VCSFAAIRRPRLFSFWLVEQQSNEETKFVGRLQRPWLLGFLVVKIINRQSAIVNA